jgi:hypothetical protein
MLLRKKAHAIKILDFVYTLTGLIKALRFARETIHDIRVYKNKGFEICQKIKLLADVGFQCMLTQLSYVRNPKKPLTNTQKKERKKYKFMKKFRHH